MNSGINNKVPDKKTEYQKPNISPNIHKPTNSNRNNQKESSGYNNSSEYNNYLERQIIESEMKMGNNDKSIFEHKPKLKNSPVQK